MPPRLRELPGELRVVLAAFLLTAAAGYAAALAQVHYQAAGPGELLPGPSRVRDIYSGPRETPRSRIEQLLETAHGPFNGSGTMRPAFTTKSRDWAELTSGKPLDVVARLADEREGERLALLAWVRAGADRAAYDRDDFAPGPEFVGQPVTPAFAAGPDRVKIRSIIQVRCADCHAQDGRDELARAALLDTYDRIRPHAEVRGSTARMPLPKLAQTTHAHLFGLGLLFTATGVLFCLTSVPRRVRLVVAPLPLVAQGIDIACWWLSRWDSAFVWGIVAGGAAAGVGLAAHVVVGLWELSRSRCVPSGGGLEYEQPPAQPDAR